MSRTIPAAALMSDLRSVLRVPNRSAWMVLYGRFILSSYLK